MKNLFLTTALVLPLAMAPALAQQPVTPSPEAAQDDSIVTDPAADPTLDSGTVTDPATGALPDGGTVPDPATDGTQADSTATDPAGDAPPGTMQPLDDAITDAETQAITEEAAVVTDPDKVVQQQAANELRLDWITGASVTSPDGETIGSVSDLILDRDSGQMAAAVIGVGGFLGIGEKKIAVPWDRLTIDYDANQITSDLSRAEADAAPEYAFRDRESLPPPVETAAPVATQ